MLVVVLRCIAESLFLSVVAGEYLQSQVEVEVGEHYQSQEEVEEGEYF